MVVKIYGESRAVSPQRVIHCLVEKGVAFELVHVDLDSMENQRPDFLAKQPFGQVPYVAEGDFHLFESRAIARYYAAKYAERGPKLLGRTAEERAKVEQWLDVEAINYNPLAWEIAFNLFILPVRGVAGDEAEAMAAAGKLERVLQVYERQLSRSKYLAGDEFTLADLTHIPATSFLVDKCGLGRLLDGKPHVRAWWEDVTARPGWKKVVSFVEAGTAVYSP